MKELSDISQRFLQVCDYLHISGYKLAQMGVIGSQATMTKIKQGKQKPSLSTIDKMCSIYELSKVWLLTGEGTMLNASDSSPHAVVGDVSNSNVAVNGSISINKNKQQMSTRNQQKDDMEGTVPAKLFEMFMESQRQQVNDFITIVQQQKDVIEHLLHRLSVRVDASEEKNAKLLEMYEKLHTWQEEHEKRTDANAAQIIRECKTVDAEKLMAEFLKRYRVKV